ncbi:MAG: tRNA lysidine(34) synthetase TilS, partial [Deltaproteobacteria bacterium]
DAARQARYSFLWESAERMSCNRLATGHHRDDQAETVLMRLLCGSTLLGLGGIRPVDDSGRLIRPLLELSRKELEAFARCNHIPYAEDSSNLSEKYLRNRLRHKLIPEIERKYDPAFTRNLILLGEEAAFFRQCLEDRFRQLRDSLVEWAEGDSPRINCPAAAELPLVLRRYLLRRIVFDYTAGGVILSGRVLDAVDRLLVRGTSGRRLDLPGGLVACREFDFLSIGEKKSAPTGAQPEQIEIKGPGKTTIILGGLRWELSFEVRPYEAGTNNVFFQKEGAEGVWEERFDRDKLKFPLYAGAWRAGERIQPFGLEGTKKLKKLFLEKRIPCSMRMRIPVLRDSRGEVLWVCGVARSALGALSPESTSVLLVRALCLPVRGFTGVTIIDT